MGAAGVADGVVVRYDDEARGVVGVADHRDDALVGAFAVGGEAAVDAVQRAAGRVEVGGARAVEDDADVGVGVPAAPAGDVGREGLPRGVEALPELAHERGGGVDGVVAVDYYGFHDVRVMCSRGMELYYRSLSTYFCMSLMRTYHNLPRFEAAKLPLLIKFLR